MKKRYLSRIEWIPYEEGGRNKVPASGTRYCPIIFIDKLKDEKWSIDFICPDFSKTNIIQFSFLVNNAPEDRIKIDCEYDLYEGNRKVAKVIIDSESDFE